MTKLIINTKELKQAVNSAALFVNAKGFHPILGHLAFMKEGESLIVESSNLDYHFKRIIQTVSGLNDDFKPFTVNVKALKAFLSSVKSKEVSLDYDDDTKRVSIVADSNVCKLECLSVFDFPCVDYIDAGETTIESTAGVILKALQAVAPCMANDGARYYLNGVNMRVDGGGILILESTDGHTLSNLRLTTGVKIEGTQFGIIPCEFVKNMIKVLKDCNPEERITFKTRFAVLRGMLQVESDGFRALTKFIDGKYPKPEDIDVCIKRGFFGKTIFATFKKSELAAALKAAAKGEKYPKVAITFGNHVKIELRGCDDKSFETVINADIEGLSESLQIGFNANLLLRVLDCLDGESVRFHLRNDNDASGLTGVDDSHKCVIMPMRL